MATDISLDPPIVNLTVYKGDSINLRFNLTENGGAYLIPANTNFGNGTIGAVSGSGPYTATISAITSTAGLAVGQKVFATSGTGNLGTGIVTISSVPSATSITISATSTITAGNITAINIGGWQGSIKKSSDSSFIGAINLTGTSGNSYIEAYVPNTITTNFIAGTAYKYDIQYTWVESGKAYLKTFVKGTITVLEDVTLASDA